MPARNRRARHRNRNGGRNRESNGIDFSVLRTPLFNAVSGFGQAKNMFDQATEELKDLLSHECDLIYECKVCRNIHRSMANFISHKRLYCTDKCSNGKISRARASLLMGEIRKLNRLERYYQDCLHNNNAQFHAEHDLGVLITNGFTCDEETEKELARTSAASNVPGKTKTPDSTSTQAGTANNVNDCEMPSPSSAPMPGERHCSEDSNKGTTRGHNLATEPDDTSEESEGTSDSDTEEEQEEEEVILVPEETPMDVGEDNNTPTKAEELPEKEDSPPNQGEPTLIFRDRWARLAEKRNFVAFKQKIEHSIDYATLTCKKCDTQYDEVHQLYNHMAAHIKWVRYTCKLCDFKHYNLENLPEHLKMVHNVKGESFNYVEPVVDSDAIDLPEKELDTNETSPDAGQPRCPTDSTRLTDESSPSDIQVEGAGTKRKLGQTECITKRKKEFTPTGGEDGKDVDVIEKVTSNLQANSSYEEISPEIDNIDNTAVASEGPVTKKTKPYNLSNLPQMEEQGSGGSQSMTTAKLLETENKPQPENKPNDDNVDCSGALLTNSNVTAKQSSAFFKIGEAVTNAGNGPPKTKTNEDQNITHDSPKTFTSAEAEVEAGKSLIFKMSEDSHRMD